MPLNDKLALGLKCVLFTVVDMHKPYAQRLDQGRKVQSSKDGLLFKDTNYGLEYFLSTVVDMPYRYLYASVLHLATLLSLTTIILKDQTRVEKFRGANAQAYCPKAYIMDLNVFCPLWQICLSLILKDQTRVEKFRVAKMAWLIVQRHTL